MSDRGHSHSFDNPDGICIVIKVFANENEMLTYELSDDINHVTIH